jgi:anti-sigma-K factor RskA
MSDDRENIDRQALAAEHALDVLAGVERDEARKVEASDRTFAGEVARWRGRLASLFDEVEAVSPPGELWDKIEAATRIDRGASNVVALRRSAGRWRAMAVGMTALAASLGLVIIRQPQTAPTPVVQARSAPLVAMLGDSDKQMKVVASWDPAGRQLVIAVAGDMPADPSHSHELWVIPTGGEPRSLGTMPPVRKMHMRLADTLAQLLKQGATIAISVEPPGGSPSGKPTGPVVVSGSLDQA